MDRSEFSAGRMDGAPFTPAGGSAGVQWVRPATARGFAPPPRGSSAGDRAERTNTLIVIVLTLACTALALCDLIMLASGV
jgi:hypothetical protein